MTSNTTMPEHKGEPIDLEAHGIKYGFRHDPIEWLKASRSLAAARVRMVVFNQASDDDERLLQEDGERAIRQIVARQKPDGTFGHSASTGGALVQLLDAGIDRQDPRLAEVAETFVRQFRAGDNGATGESSDDELSVYGLRGLCMLDRRDIPEVERSLRLIAKREEQWNDPWSGCFQCPPIFWNCLLAGRHIIPDVDVDAVIDKGFRRITAATNAFGACTWKNSNLLLEVAARVDTPFARAYVRTQILPVLRRQSPNGELRDVDFAALVAYGLLDQLMDRPPLPADWRVIRALPTPKGDLTSLTYAGEYFWVLDQGTKEAIALSPEDGAVVCCVKSPLSEPVGLGSWDGGVCILQCDPHPGRLVKLSPETGNIEREAPVADFCPTGCAKVGNELWVCDNYDSGVYRICTRDMSKQSFMMLAGPGPVAIAAAADGVWHLEGDSVLVKSDFDGRLVDWGEKPFGKDTTGIAFDGNGLWVLDNKNKRICLIEKTDSGKEITQALAAKREAER